jgi:hypothetical protein
MEEGPCAPSKTVKQLWYLEWKCDILSCQRCFSTRSGGQTLLILDCNRVTIPHLFIVFGCRSW